MTKCRHAWSADFVCSSCGMIRHARVPYWALVVPMPSGPRGVWLGLWSFWDRGRPPGPITAGNKAIAERSGGITAGTLVRHLDRLEAMRRIARRGLGRRREILLAWGSPGEISEIASSDPRNIATPDPRNIATRTPAISPRTPAISPPHLCNIATQILSDLIEELRGVCPPAISAEFLEAILTLDRDWSVSLRDRAWSAALAEAIRELGLTPRDVTRVLAAWTAADRAQPDGPARLAAQRAGVYPPRREVWWTSRHGAWLRRALDQGTRAAPRAAAWIPDPCDDDTDQQRPWAP